MIKLSIRSESKFNLSGIAVVFLGALFTATHAVASVACPPADATHRYLDVPIYYGQPENGTFHLYYEVNHDFDPRVPSIFYLHDGQQPMSAVGDSDKLQRRFGTRLNVVRIEHRGMDCARVPGFDGTKDVDGIAAFDAFNYTNVLADIEQVRVDLLGRSGKIYLYGGSGGGVLAAQYLALHPAAVSRVYLERTAVDLGANSVRARAYFLARLQEEGAYDLYISLLRKPPVPLAQMLWLIQRIGYDYRPEQRELGRFLKSVSDGDRTLFDSLTKEYGDVLATGAGSWRLQPFAAVRIFEILPQAGTIPPLPSDINGIAPLISRLTELATIGLIPHEPIDLESALAGLPNEACLISSKWDHVFPGGIEELHGLLPASRLVVLDDIHRGTATQKCDDGLIRAFFENGKDSLEFESALKQPTCKLWPIRANL